MTTVKKGTSTNTNRACSVCLKAGHNARTCPDKPKTEEIVDADAEGVQEAAPPKVRAPSVALAVVEPSSGGSVSHLPLEFEENSKQLHVNGTTLKLTMREYEQGIPNYTIRYQREDKGATDLHFDQEQLLRLHELSGWALQRTATTSTLPVRAVRPTSNGSAAKTHPSS